MPTPAAKRSRSYVLYASMAILLTALIINGIGWELGNSRLRQVHTAANDNHDTNCDTKDAVSEFLREDHDIRKKQVINSRKSLKAQRIFVKHTHALLVLFEKAPNQKAIAPIELYLRDQITMTEAQIINSRKNTDLSEQAANYFSTLRNNLAC